MEATMELDAVQILRLRPGDVLVVKHPQVLSERAKQNIREAFDEAGLQDFALIVLDDGLELEVVRKD